MTKQKYIETVKKFPRDWLCSKDALLDILNRIEEPYWQTGTPTEEGDYLITLNTPSGPCFSKLVYSYIADVGFKNDSVDYVCDPGIILAWHKIEDYENKNTEEK